MLPREARSPRHKSFFYKFTISVVVSLTIIIELTFASGLNELIRSILDAIRSYRVHTIFSSVAFATLVACAQAVAVNLTILTTSGRTARLEDNAEGGFNVVLVKGSNAPEVIAMIGLTMGEAISISSSSPTVIQFANNTTLTVSSEVISGRGEVISLAWEAPKNSTLGDCVNFGSYHWYGGPQQKAQYWPIEKLRAFTYSYVTKEADNCGVAERYFLNSAGHFYYLDKKVPLFVDANVIMNNSVCFLARVTAPYSSKREKNTLSYVIAIFENVRKAHEYAIEKYLKKPTGYPDELMIKYPIWSTWARYKRDVNHEVVLEFADEINKYGFPNSQFELDDLWEVCYGSMTVNKTRFPSLKNTTDILRSKGFRTTMWAHPFINKGCNPWYSNAVRDGYVVSAENGTVESHWWNDNETTTSYIDFTKPAVKEWYVQRLVALKTETGIDGYKFDGGESSWSPQIPVLSGDIYEQPNLITSEYVRTVAQFGSLVEVRVGFGTQDLPIFVRMIDKDTYWTFENGLPTLITTMFQMNLNGYPLVLPDMIGGNGYNEPPSKELFIRWLQANTFMPSLQFSYVPWDFDNDTITISKRYVDLHAEYTPKIIEACKKAVSDGSPVNMPIWWISPTDTEAQGIWDEYLLGESILVAPVVTPNTTARDIYLPKGTWYDQGNKSKVYTGPMWIRNYPAPIDVLPYFISSSTAPLCSAFLVLVGFFASVMPSFQ